MKNFGDCDLGNVLSSIMPFYFIVRHKTRIA